MHIHEGAWVVYVYSWRGLSRGEFGIELGQRSTESKLQLIEVRKGQHHHSILYLGGVLSSCRAQRYVSDCYVHPLRRNQDLFYPIVSWLFFLCSCILSLPLRSLITETWLRASTVARLRPQTDLGPQWLLLRQESHTWFSFSGDPLPYLLTIPLN